MMSTVLFLLPLVVIQLAFGRNVHGVGKDEEGALSPFGYSGAVGDPIEGWLGNGLGEMAAFPADGGIGAAPGGRREFGAGPVEGDDGNAGSGRKFGGGRGPFGEGRGGRRGGRGRHGKHYRHCNGTTEATTSVDTTTTVSLQ
uniref:Nodule-specific Glycine Rich Peptide n=1 Tax=Steinernema glaseri TaxID=37863 RepID=A0A1I7ZUE7_9BILA